MYFQNVQNSKIEISVDSTEEPITLLEAKKWLRVDSNDDDDLICSLISSCVSDLENYFKQPILTKTIIFHTSTSQYDRYGNEFIYIPYTPTNTPVVSIFNESDTETTLTTEKIYGKKINLGIHNVTPREDHAYKVVFQAGIASSASNCPEGIKYALKEMVSLKYDGGCSDKKKEDILKEVSYYVNMSQLYA